MPKSRSATRSILSNGFEIPSVVQTTDPDIVACVIKIEHREPGDWQETRDKQMKAVEEAWMKHTNEQRPLTHQVLPARADEILWANSVSYRSPWLRQEIEKAHVSPAALWWLCTRGIGIDSVSPPTKAWGAILYTKPIAALPVVRFAQWAALYQLLNDEERLLLRRACFAAHGIPGLIGSPELFVSCLLSAWNRLMLGSVSLGDHSIAPFFEDALKLRTPVRISPDWTSYLKGFRRRDPGD